MKKRNKLIEILKNKGIETRPGFYPFNRMKPFIKYCKGKYNSTEDISLKSISLPSSPFLKKSELKYITSKFVKEVEKII